MATEFIVDSSHWSLFSLECAEYDCGSPSCLEVEDMHHLIASTDCTVDDRQPAMGMPSMHTDDWNADEDRFGWDEDLFFTQPELTFNQWLMS